jgi:SulP family sulfate permease
MAELRNSFSFRDVIAGVSVALVVIPQSLAYAEIVQLPAVMGLYAAALPALAAAPFGSSRYLQVGPVAMTALLSWGALSTVAEPGSPEYIELALLLAILVGVVRLALGLVKAGSIANYMSPPVILGFSTAAAILIAASQIASVTGVVDPPADLIERLIEVVTQPGDWNWQAIGLSAAVGAVVIGGRKIHPLLPGVLLVVIGGIFIGATTGYSGELIGSLPQGLPPLSLAMPWARLPELFVPGIVIAVVGFAEATAISRTLAVRDRERWDANKELIAIGVANVTSGISGGFPIGGSFSRSSVNDLAGARSRWSGAITGITVLAFMPFASVLADLPKAVLGAIVIAAIYPLIRIRDMVNLMRVTRGQAAIAFFTAIATIALAPRIDLGVVLGVIAAGSLHLHRESQRIQIPVSYEDGTLTLTLQPHGVLYYGSAGPLYETLAVQLAAHDDCRTVELDLSRLGRIDHTGFEALKSFAEIVRGAELTLEVANLPTHAKGLFERAGGL